jgi:uncharacterized protein (TIGR02271 family)
MDVANTTVVIGKGDVWGTVESGYQVTAGEEVTIRLSTGQKIVVPSHLLVLQEDGNYHLPLDLASLESLESQDNTIIMPVVVEELDVQKRRVETGGVRITKVVHEQEETVNEPLLQEEVEVERIPVNRPVDGPIPIRYSGDTMIISILEEALVVEKRLMLKEEIHIRKQQKEIRKPQTIIVRQEEAIIEHMNTTKPEA